MPTMRRHRVIDNLGFSSLGFRGFRFRGAQRFESAFLCHLGVDKLLDMGYK